MAKKPRGCLSFFFRIFSVFAVLVIVFNVVFQFVLVDGESMRPTFDNGNWILACRFVKPTHGDIVVTNKDNVFQSRLIKRAIAFGGDTVDIDFDRGIVYVNGDALQEPYIAEGKFLRGDVSFPLTVPEGRVFLLGDNRPNSLDSRNMEIGLIPEADITGTILLKLWSGMDT